MQNGKTSFQFYNCIFLFISFGNSIMRWLFHALVRSFREWTTVKKSIPLFTFGDLPFTSISVLGNRRCYLHRSWRPSYFYFIKYGSISFCQIVYPFAFMCNLSSMYITGINFPSAVSIFAYTSIKPVFALPAK